jgi:pentapeptide MXKDX repeat protein
VNPVRPVNLEDRLGVSGRDWSKQNHWSQPDLNFTERNNMRKLISILVAAVFALSSGFALAASHTGAQPMEKKDEMKKDDKSKDKKKKSKKSTKKEAKKDGAKKDEMKK